MGNQPCAPIIHSNSNSSAVILPHNSSILYYVILYFVIGLVMAPWSAGLLFIILFLLAYDLLVGWFRYQANDYFLFDRVAMAAATIYGFIVGRTLVGDLDPVENKQSMLQQMIPGL